MCKDIILETTVYIQNLKCHGCASTIKNKLSKLEDVLHVSVDVENNSVTFNHNMKSTKEKVNSELLKIGYPIDGQVNKFQTKAKSYVSCAIGRINK